jgi:CheY-like chemotaxis protein
MVDKINILVAEDNAFNQLIIGMLLRDSGVECIVVNNGKEALLQLSQRSFDLIFMDIEMPEMDGREAVRFIRSSASESVRRIPVIGFTSHHDAATLCELKTGGFIDFIHKPFKKEEIVAMIDRYVLKKEEENPGITLKPGAIEEK